MVGEFESKPASVPEVVKGLFGGVEAPGGCSWRVGEVVDERLGRFLLVARGLCDAK